MSKNKNKRNKGGDTREFTAVKNSDCKNSKNCDRQNEEQQMRMSDREQQMRMSDREQKPGFEV